MLQFFGQYQFGMREKIVKYRLKSPTAVKHHKNVIKNYLKSQKIVKYYFFVDIDNAMTCVKRLKIDIVNRFDISQKIVKHYKKDVENDLTCRKHVKTSPKELECCHTQRKCFLKRF